MVVVITQLQALDLQHLEVYKMSYVYVVNGEVKEERRSAPEVWAGFINFDKTSESFQIEHGWYRCDVIKPVLNFGEEYDIYDYIPKISYYQKVWTKKEIPIQTLKDQALAKAKSNAEAFVTNNVPTIDILFAYPTLQDIDLTPEQVTLINNVKEKYTKYEWDITHCVDAIDLDCTYSYEDCKGE